MSPRAARDTPAPAAPRIDPRAIVSPRAELAPDVTVGPYSIIGDDVVIGPATVIGPHAVINGPTRMGAGNRVYQFASIGEAPQDKKHREEPTRLEIGDRNIFREFCTIHRGTIHDRGVTQIGSDSLFMAYTHVAHDCSIGDNVVMANCATMGGHVGIGDFVQLGGLSALHQFCQIGAHAFVGGGAIVSRDVPPYVTITGNPAVPHGVNAEGLKRRGFTAEQIRNIRNAYRILYRSELKLSDALQQLRTLAQEQPELAILVEFIGRSQRSLQR
ncbi:MAG TPA: acyl-ACP--UDP-N-acetylglucosamine O-acyltransferase [Steroidobacteraceae bacterium]|nr:acyl-ACP--UDP-N-acetylglucosamine O-acyltransferase [Steroidobacteraceae bacterium]